MTPLSEDLEVFLEAERDIDVPARSERERLLGRLQPLLVVPVALAAASTVPLADSAVLSSALKAKVALAVVSAALLGGAVGVTSHAYFTSPPAPRAVMPVAPPPSKALPRPPEPAEAAPAEPAVAPPLAPSAAASPSPSAPHAESARPAGSLRAERLLIETASAALMRGDRESAITALRQHAQRFPKGALAEEREVLLAKARAAPRGGSSP